jgi:hypothetical protein
MAPSNNMLSWPLFVSCADTNMTIGASRSTNNIKGKLPLSSNIIENMILPQLKKMNCNILIKINAVIRSIFSILSILYKAAVIHKLVGAFVDRKHMRRRRSFLGS